MRGAEQSIGGGCHDTIGIHKSSAPAADRTIASTEGGQHTGDTQRTGAPPRGPTTLSAERDQPQHDNHSELVSLCGQIRELLQRRRDLHGPEKSLTLRILGLCRRLCDGDKGEAKKLYKAISGKKIGDHPQAMAAHVLTLPFFTASRPSRAAQALAPIPTWLCGSSSRKSAPGYQKG